jgi:hypothetical protein
MNISAEDKSCIVEWARKHPEIRAVYLFGSRAKETNRPDSDIDLAVRIVPRPHEVTQLVWSDWHRRYEAKPDLNTSHPPHLWWYEEGVGLERIEKAVKQHGVLLYSIE